MINNVLGQTKNVGKITDEIINHIDKEKDIMLKEEANIFLREHNVDVREEELCKKFAIKAAKRKAAKKQAAQVRFQAQIWADHNHNQLLKNLYPEQT